MSTYFTALVLTYLVQGQEDYFYSKTLFPSHQACVVASDAIYPLIYIHYRNSMAHCERTDVPSSSIRPKIRPQNLLDHK
jgi:hypothetical protein